MTFGTAGLRGQMGSGPACMNELSILQATQVSIVSLARSTSPTPETILNFLPSNDAEVYLFVCFYLFFSVCVQIRYENRASDAEGHLRRTHCSHA